MLCYSRKITAPYIIIYCYSEYTIICLLFFTAYDNGGALTRLMSWATRRSPKHDIF